MRVLLMQALWRCDAVAATSSIIDVDDVVMGAFAAVLLRVVVVVSVDAVAVSLAAFHWKETMPISPAFNLWFSPVCEDSEKPFPVEGGGEAPRGWNLISGCKVLFFLI